MKPSEMIALALREHAVLLERERKRRKFQGDQFRTIRAQMKEEADLYHALADRYQYQNEGNHQ